MTSLPSQATSESLVGKTVMVTGAASGIGRACVEHFTQVGAKVYCVDRDGSGLQSLADDVAGVEPLACDLADLDATQKLPVDVDVLINNAGVQHISSIVDFPLDRFDLIMRLMLHSPFVLARQCLPHMYAQGWGRVVNLSSVHGLRASAYKSAYVMAKHGLEGLSKTIALEGAEHGVTSNCVNPAYVRTPLVENQITDQAAAHGISEQDVVSDIMLAPAAVKRLIEPSEVAALVAFLCGPHSASVSGSSFSMDGAWTCH